MNTLRPAACGHVVVAERHWSTRRDRRSRGQLRACCNISTCTASTGGKTLSASRSKTRSIRTPAPRPYRRFASRNFSELYSGRLAYACQRPGRAASCTSLTAVTLRWPPTHNISPPVVEAFLTAGTAEDTGAVTAVLSLVSSPGCTGAAVNRGEQPGTSRPGASTARIRSA